MTTLLLLVVTAYVLLAALSAAAALHARAHPPVAAADLPDVCVIVPARDEEAALPACLTALAAQDYPADRFEVVVADDGSTDGTAAVARAFAGRDARFRCLPVPAPPPGAPLCGKAHALHEAVRATRAPLLLTTDADCTPPPGWARHLASQFHDPDVGMACGVTVVAGARTLLHRVQALDWLLLLVTAAAASALGRPLTAMGNNMAFRRAAYAEVGGYPALPLSVTEDYALFRAVHRTRRWRARLLLDAALRNHTRPLERWRDVFRQRRRWARGGLRAAPWTYGLYLVVFLTHLLLAAGLFVAPLTAVLLLALKLTADHVLLRLGRQQLGLPARPRGFLCFEAYLFAYVVVLPAALLLAPRITWKGRRY